MPTPTEGKCPAKGGSEGGGEEPVCHLPEPPSFSPTPRPPWHPSGNMRDGLEALFNLEENLEAFTVLRD